ncbi:cell filamentation protein Fic [Lentibacillus salicampi]|uniref:Cell filamentation protein Fic n=1 Tax=Lentibacillus salicampi TaxID=175306 RepID=A0A4Y9AB40_9BACI|nr:RhuM family protein [Lentibacillus salicampi]TFJ92417.1 cell filamentation protein Fic [Lentibacillus salicampi]
MNNESDVLIYQTKDGDTKIDVRLEDESVWMTQKAIAELYQTTKQNISLHIKNTFEERELDENSVVKFYLITAKDGKNYKTKHYNLEMIIAIGYRVRSHRGTQFRQWATERLHEYLVKGFTMDDDRLKDMRTFGQDYFDELLERIRDIRASEKRFYQKITDIYATSVDYDPNTRVTQEFFATVQNKLHFAIHGKTAAELIADRANAQNENMGLTS